MPAKAQTLITLFQSHGGILRFSAILKAGFHLDLLTALEREGTVERIGRGLYHLTKYSIASYPDLVTASISNAQRSNLPYVCTCFPRSDKRDSKTC